MFFRPVGTKGCQGIVLQGEQNVELWDWNFQTMLVAEDEEGLLYAVLKGDWVKLESFEIKKDDEKWQLLNNKCVALLQSTLSIQASYLIMHMDDAREMRNRLLIRYSVEKDRCEKDLKEMLTNICQDENQSIQSYLAEIDKRLAICRSYGINLDSKARTDALLKGLKSSLKEYLLPLQDIVNQRHKDVSEGSLASERAYEETVNDICNLHNYLRFNPPPPPSPIPSPIKPKIVSLPNELELRSNKQTSDVGTGTLDHLNKETQTVELKNVSNALEESMTTTSPAKEDKRVNETKDLLKIGSMALPIGSGSRIFGLYVRKTEHTNLADRSINIICSPRILQQDIEADNNGQIGSSTTQHVKNKENAIEPNIDEVKFGEEAQKEVKEEDEAETKAVDVVNVKAKEEEGVSVEEQLKGVEEVKEEEGEVKEDEGEVKEIEGEVKEEEEVKEEKKLKDKAEVKQKEGVNAEEEMNAKEGVREGEEVKEGEEVEEVKEEEDVKEEAEVSVNDQAEYNRQAPSDPNIPLRIDPRTSRMVTKKVDTTKLASKTSQESYHKTVSEEKDKGSKRNDSHDGNFEKGFVSGNNLGLSNFTSSTPSFYKITETVWMKSSTDVSFSKSTTVEVESIREAQDNGIIFQDSKEETVDEKKFGNEKKNDTNDLPMDPLDLLNNLTFGVVTQIIEM